MFLYKLDADQKTLFYELAHKIISSDGINNTSENSMIEQFKAEMRFDELGDYKLKGAVVTEVKISETDLTAGWNRLSWTSNSGGDWANIDWHSFTLLPAPSPFLLIVR